jgi:hypothetical protein
MGSIFLKPHSLDEIFVLHLTEVHFYKLSVPDFIQKFNDCELGVDPRFDINNQIFLCYYEEQAREIIRLIGEDNGKTNPYKLAKGVNIWK